MAEISGFFNSFEGDRRYYISFLAEYFSSFVGNGIFWGGNYMKVVPFGGNMDIQVQIGKAWINGYYYANKDAPKTLTLLSSHLTLARIDTIVLRLDLTESARAVYTAVKSGTPSATPVAPSLQRDDAIWELKLAEVRINPNVSEVFAANITDFRLNSEYCGIVTNWVPNDFTLDEVFDQYLSQLELRMADWDRVKTQQQNDWQDQMDSQENSFDTKISNFNSWFNGAQTDLVRAAQYLIFALATQPGNYGITAFPADGSIINTIRKKSNNLLVAIGTTTYPLDGSIIYEEIVYQGDGIAKQRHIKIITTFPVDGSINQEVINLL